MTDKLPKLPTAPREVIEHIRRYEFGIGASLDAESRVVVANMQRRYQSLLATVAEDLNSKESHFILSWSRMQRTTPTPTVSPQASHFQPRVPAS